ncbi:ATP-dependent DNA helicase [Pseudomonas knackmussii]|uniref:ATP-dependent DNA helicase n=1 Tax=Pseudomonas knackmussii TaxID=65741 RepID=UPI003F4A2A38
MGALLEMPLKATSELTQHQQAAYDLLLAVATGGKDTMMATLEGYAGTGKTFLMGKLVKELSEEGIRVAIAAPTNKAVAVLREKVGGDLVHAASIHSLLGLKMKELENGAQECVPDGESSLHEYGVVVVDECSMVSQDMFSRILFSRGACKVIFVGDPAQLPPVGDDLESPVFRDVKMRVRLSEIVRQAADNPIIGLSMQIRSAIEEQRRVGYVELSQSLHTDGPAKAGFVTGGSSAVFDIALQVHQGGGDCRVVAYTNKQVRQYNLRLHQALYGYTDCEFSPGESVIAHEEMRATEMVEASNGELISVGTSVRIITSEELEVVDVSRAEGGLYGFEYFQLILRRDDGSLVRAAFPAIPGQLEDAIRQRWAEWRAIKAQAEAEQDATQRRKLMEKAKEMSGHTWAIRRAFAPLRHAYAITAHKSQGSTFHTVIVDWGDLSGMRRDFEFNRALYVACTRASEHLAIVV